MPTLDWLNRAAAFTTAAKVPYRLLEQVSTHTANTVASPENTINNIATEAIDTPAIGQNSTKNDAHADNLLIQGDNLEALKALLPFYRGQVKCIFIDPPYNTKSAFEHYDDNLEHAQWLSMMLPRLQLLRELLREDGSIWVTIDDNEGHYLKVLMDEVFGRGNFVANVVWQKRVSPANDATHFSSDHDNIIVFAKQKTNWALNRLERTELQNSYYKNPDNDHRGDWNSVTYTGNKTRLERPNLYYGIRNPNTNEMVFPPETLTWRYGEETHLKNEKENLLYWGKNGDSKAPRMKMFLDSASAVVPRSVWSAADAGSTQLSMTEQKTLFANAFGTPKPELLLQRILNIATNEGDLVLDSFLGSGTTAAVAHKMGRRWIGIEMGEHAETHCLPRIKKVLDGEQGGISKAVGWGVSTLEKPWTGGGFRFMRLGDAVFDDRGRINPAVRFATLAAFIWQQDTHTALNLAASKPGTPHIGTHYIFNSALGNKYAGYSQIEPLKQGETADLAFDSVRPEPFDGLRTGLVEGFAEASTGSARTEGDAARTELDLPQTPKGTAYYLLYNGILGDKRPASGNVLTREVLAALLELHAQVLADAPAGAKLDLIVYGEACRLGEERLKQAKVTFRHIPYDVRAR